MGGNFYKCGEITISIKVGENFYFFKCNFCATICSHSEAFISHVEHYHYNDLYKDEEIEKSTGGGCTIQETDNDLLCEDKIQVPDQDNGVTIPYIDPLEVSMHGDSVFCLKREEGYLQCSLSNSQLEEVKDRTDDEELNTSDKLTVIELSGESENESSSGAETVKDVVNEIHLNDKNLLLTIISAYEKARVLWDPNDANAKNKKKREKAIKKIGNSVKRKHNILLNNQEIKERIKRARDKFRIELQNQRFMEIEGEEFWESTSFYFEKLSFLKKVITYKPRSKRGTKALANEKSPLPLPNLTHDQNLKFIEIYKSFSCLWDTQHIGFRFKAQRTEAINDMIESIENRMDFHITQEELMKKLYRIRYACTQDKHRKLECERLETEFRPSSKYFEKISFLFDHVGPFKCDFCEEVFNGADQYKIHKSEHDGSMPFVCPICKRGFMKVGNCTVHLRRHTRDYPFECKFCSKRFATTTDVKVHMRYHTGEKPYFCEICGQSFRTWSFFGSHMRRHQKRPSHICTICDRAFYENNKLTEHMKAHSNVRDKVCNICDKTFTSTKYLRQHKQIHSATKKYICKICKKDFAQYAGLSGHMKSHGTTIAGGGGPTVE